MLVSVLAQLSTYLCWLLAQPTASSFTIPPHGEGLYSTWQGDRYHWWVQHHYVWQWLLPFTRCLTTEVGLLSLHSVQLEGWDYLEGNGCEIEKFLSDCIEVKYPAPIQWGNFCHLMTNGTVINIPILLYFQSLLIHISQVCNTWFRVVMIWLIF